MMVAWRIRGKYWLRPLLVLAAAAVSMVPPAFATFPGANGRIVYRTLVGANTPSSHYSLVVTGQGPLNVSGYDSPAWSPDGSRIAFVASDGIRVVNRDGTGEHLVISNSVFTTAFILSQGIVSSGPYSASSPAWTADGRRLSFVLLSVDQTLGIWTANADGTGITLTIVDLTARSPSWSVTNQMVYSCNFRRPGQSVAFDLCIYDARANTIRQLRIDCSILFSPCGSLGNTRGPKWMPDGNSITFTYDYATGNSPHIVNRTDVFTIQADGTGLRALTFAYDGCPGRTTDIGTASAWYYSPAPSPDGKWIVALGRQYTAFREVFVPHYQCLSSPGPVGLFLLDPNGGPPSLLVSDQFATFNGAPDWQPITQGLAVNFLDGHQDPLQGLKVELRQNNPTQDLIDDRPINTAGGSYVFEDGLVPGQTYLLNAYLVDHCQEPCTPAFDVRYAPGPDEPVWEQWYFTAGASTQSPFTFNFGLDPQLQDSNIDASQTQRLADMAAIYFRTRQYLTWVKARLTPDTGPTVHLYTFAQFDPASPTVAVDPDTAYYSLATDNIVIPPKKSDYEDRDGVADGSHPDDAPQNVEWHEFTHHLYATWVKNTDCGGEASHGGYNNPDTCASMNEGFATFLPTLAGREILGLQSATVEGPTGPVVVQSSDSFYGNVWDLRFPTFAWGSRCCFRDGTLLNTEDFAVAALLWDLVGRSNNTQQSGILAANGLPQTVTYSNSAGDLPLAEVWSEMTSNHLTSILGLRQSFSEPTPSIDLDGDGVADIAPIDVPFLMHGFYPIDTDQLLTPAHDVNFYDVGYAQRSDPYALRDAAVGLSSHYRYDSSGNPTGIIPRYGMLLGQHSNIALTVQDADGAPLAGATAILAITYPGGQSTAIRRLGNGLGNLVHLELPAYFNYLLPADAPLPPCDPAHDLQVTVTVTVVKDGTPSTETPSFDNCAYYHAMAAAAGPAALSFTVTVPVAGGGDTIAPATTAAVSPQPNAAGWNNSAVAVALSATDNAGGSGVKQITYSASGAQNISTAVVAGSSAIVAINNDGQTTLSYFATDNDGNSEAANQLVLSVDQTAPAVQCGASDGQWHAADVSIGCTASDATSGLNDPQDATFSLSTAVAAGSETAEASTGSRAICDVAGNCAPAGPVGGLKVDKKAPVIAITTPAAGTYLLNQQVTADYSCSDGGSGVASCAGPTPSGQNLDTASVGNVDFAVNSADNVGNTSTASVRFTVVYNVCPLYDASRSVHSGATVPLKIELCDAGNADVSSAAIVVHATSLVQVSSNASEDIQDAGNANPDSDFRYDTTLGLSGGYIFNLGTSGLATGQYALRFTAGNDPAVHELLFQVR